MITAQQKIEFVANKLGLDTLYQMQGSTGCIYDVDTERVGQCFTNVGQHQNPGVGNLNTNRFEVNEALLVETIAIYSLNNDPASPNFKEVDNLQRIYGSDAVVVFDLIIGNKRVMRDTPIFLAGNPTTFASGGYNATAVSAQQIPRNQIFLEGAGILIPPQVEFSINYKIFSMLTGAQETLLNTAAVGFYLFGTKVNLNFNTTL
jgi:hypothetical protein